MFGGYIRGPLTVAHRNKLSRSHRKRLGIPDGHVIVYGHHIPFEHADPLRYWAYWIAWKFDPREAEKFVREQVESDYKDMPELREAWVAKRNIAELKEIIRVIRNNSNPHYRRPSSFSRGDSDWDQERFYQRFKGRVDL